MKLKNKNKLKKNLLETKEKKSFLDWILKKKRKKQTFEKRVFSVCLDCEIKRKKIN